jgi:hypothetical protein
MKSLIPGAGATGLSVATELLSVGVVHAFSCGTGAGMVRFRESPAAKGRPL